jgi:hypothetical protein
MKSKKNGTIHWSWLNINPAVIGWLHFNQVVK